MIEEKDQLPDIAANLSRVRERMDAACRRAGRDPQEATLIAVSKTKPFFAVMEAYASGVRNFGENYVQELTQKIKDFGESRAEEPVSWHMIGHLQKNKVRYLIDQVALIHSVDTVGLARQIEAEAAKKNTTVRILLEVNVAQEESKWGFDLSGVTQAAREISSFPHLRVMGLMTSAPYTDNPESNREYFRMLKNCAQSLSDQGLIADSEPGFTTPVLSMGMSCDFEVALEEGATMVRIGTDIFGQRVYHEGGKKQ